MTTPSILLQLVTVLVFGLLSAAAGPTTQAVRRQLPTGSTPGAYHFVYHGQVNFTMKPAYPVIVSIGNKETGKSVTIKVADGKPFILEADLLPGSYWVGSDVDGDREHSPYWPADAGDFRIYANGTLSAFVPLSGMLVHIRKVTDLSPPDLHAAASEPAVLKWASVAGATRYRGYYHIDHPAQSAGEEYREDRGEFWKPFETRLPQFAMPKLQPSDLCDWQVTALDEKGRVLASGQAAFFAHGTDPKTIERGRAPVPAHIAPTAVSWPKNAGYLGVSTLPDWVSSNPKTSRVGRGRIRQEFRSPRERTIPCVTIGGVVDGSPAAQAGLRPGDNVLAIDGKPIEPLNGDSELGDSSAFSAFIRATKPGAVLTLAVRRQSADLKVPVNIGLPPGASELAVTQPVR